MNFVPRSSSPLQRIASPAPGSPTKPRSAPLRGTPRPGSPAARDGSGCNTDRRQGSATACSHIEAATPGRTTSAVVGHQLALQELPVRVRRGDGRLGKPHQEHEVASRESEDAEPAEPQGPACAGLNRPSCGFGHWHVFSRGIRPNRGGPQGGAQELLNAPEAWRRTPRQGAPGRARPPRLSTAAPRACWAPCPSAGNRPRR